MGTVRESWPDVLLLIGDFHEMDLAAAPDPQQFISKIAAMHEKGVSPNHMFGLPVPTVIGKMSER